MTNDSEQPTTVPELRAEIARLRDVIVALEAERDVARALLVQSRSARRVPAQRMNGRE